MMRVGGYDVEVRQTGRKTMALRVTPGGLVALIPRTADPESEEVRAFIERGLARLPAGAPPQVETMSEGALRDLIAAWVERLDVEVGRVQIREMRTKWASCSEQGNITLNTEILSLPRELIDYVLVHELLHLKFPSHGKGWQAMMAVYIPDWQALERRLGGWPPL